MCPPGCWQACLRMQISGGSLWRFLQGFGMGFINTPCETAAFKTVPPSLRPDATSLFTTNRRIAAGVGIAFIVTQLVASTQDARSNLTQNELL